MAKPFLTCAILVTCAAAALPRVSAAQTLTMTGTASVVAPLTVTHTSLNFGTIYPGLNKTISTSQNSSSMGKFAITGASGATVNISFGTLPGTLTGSGSATGQALTIDTWNGYQGIGATQTTGGSAFTPSASPTAVLLGATATNVWIGATVRPTYGQIAGTYTGTLIMTVVYTGS